MGDIIFLGGKIIFKVGGANFGVINFFGDALEILVETLPADFLIDEQKIGRHKNIIDGIIFLDKRGEIFMLVVECGEVICGERVENFLLSFAGRAVCQNAQGGVESVRRVENIFVVVECREVFPREIVDAGRKVLLGFCATDV